jgi:selenocysteine-specific elongation factor
VVTGTLTGGRLAVGDELTVAGRRVRVRGLQSHAESLPEVVPGRRVAVNLSGVGHDDVHRGHALVRADQWHDTRVIDATLGVLESLDHDVSRRGAYVAHIGSGEHPCTLRVIGPHAIAPGETGTVRLRLPRALPLLPGDRYVLRESGRGETVGGGEVLDVAPDLAHDWVDVGEHERLTGERVAPTIGRWVVEPDVLDAMRTDLLARAESGIDVATLDERERAVLATIETIAVERGRARLAGTDDPLADHPWLVALADAPFAPPPPDGVDRALVRLAVERGLVVERDGLWFAASAGVAARRTVARLVATKPDGVTVAEIRDALGTSRKYLLPLLGVLDGSGVTRRRGDLRIAGPRLLR